MLPTPWRGFLPMRHWLRQQPAPTQAAARDLVAVLARRWPEILTAPAQRKEIGASVVVRCAHLMPRACRSVDTFAPTLREPRDRLIELLHHLFVQYPVPRWTTATLLSSTSLAVRGAPHVPPSVLPHVGQGGSFVDAGLPIRVTRAVARALSTSTETWPRRALRQAQAQAAQIAGPVAVACAFTFARDDFGAVDEDGVARFFSFVGARQAAGHVVDRDAYVLASAGLELLRREPACDFAGRSVASLLELARARAAPYASVRDIGALPRSGVVVDDVALDGWRFNEIVDGPGLYDESLRMRHCVASYAPRIQAGQCSIFHLRNEDDGDLGVTVEVQRPSRRIVQVKGHANRQPSPEELAALARWAAKVGLRLTTTH